MGNTIYFRGVNLVFTHNPKCAGTTTRALFKDQWDRGPDGPVHDIPSDWPMDRSFAVVRHPIDRFISGVRFCIRRHHLSKRAPWQGAVSALKGLPDPNNTSVHGRRFIIHHLQRQTSPRLELRRMKYLLRFEDYETELRRVMGILNVPLPEDIGHTNAAPNRQPRTLIPRKFIPFVLDYFQPDFDAFDYHSDLY